MKRTIINPHWVNNARTVMAAEFRYSDGSVVNAVISKEDNNPDYGEIIQSFPIEEIEENTRRNINKVVSAQRAQADYEEAQKAKTKQEALFAAKLEAFELDAVMSSTDTALKAKIRRSKSTFEVMAYTAALLIKETTSE